MDSKSLKNYVVNDIDNIDILDKSYFYFWDNDLTMYRIDKDLISECQINKEDYYFLEEDFYNNTSRDFFKYLFMDNKLDVPYFRFIVLDIKNIAHEAVNNIIVFMEEVIGKIFVLNLKGLIVIFFSEKVLFDFNSIIDTIYDDFSISINFFEGCLIYKKEDFFAVFSMYVKYLHPGSYKYSSISDLILNVQEEDNKELVNLKGIVLKNLIEDYQLISLINSLFEHNLNVSKTSSIVYMHRNTINNKLDLIKSQTGLNLQNFKDSVAMYLLLKAK